MGAADFIPLFLHSTVDEFIKTKCLVDPSTSIDADIFVDEYMTFIKSTLTKEQWCRFNQSKCDPTWLTMYMTAKFPQIRFVGNKPRLCIIDGIYPRIWTPTNVVGVRLKTK